MLALFLALYAMSFWLAHDRGIHWAPVPIGVLTACLAYYASVAVATHLPARAGRGGVSVPRLAFDPVIHPPARLQIMAVLAAVRDAEFATLRQTADVSDSVLSKHLSALTEAGYVRLRKAAMDGRQRTWASLTRQGARRFAGMSLRYRFSRV